MISWTRERFTVSKSGLDCGFLQSVQFANVSNTTQYSSSGTKMGTELY